MYQDKVYSAEERSKELTCTVQKLNEANERLDLENKNHKKKDRDFRKLLSTDINELNPDEIKLKLNQIYDWNDKK